MVVFIVIALLCMSNALPLLDTYESKIVASMKKISGDSLLEPSFQLPASSPLLETLLITVEETYGSFERTDYENFDLIDYSMMNNEHRH
jgi:hypothetical protein